MRPPLLERAAAWVVSGALLALAALLAERLVG
jgi:hypothetical protein